MAKDDAVILDQSQIHAIDILSPVTGEAEVSVEFSAPCVGVWTPYGKKAPFICLEPQSHPVDAHNMEGQPGLVVLGAGDTVSWSLKIAVNQVLFGEA